MIFALDGAALPIAAACIAINLALIGALVAHDRRRTRAVDATSGLPPGAEAALLSVTEVLPDPRNHLVIKDPTSQLRLTDEDRRAAELALTIDLRERPAARAAAEREALKAARRTSRPEAGAA